MVLYCPPATRMKAGGGLKSAFLLGEVPGLDREQPPGVRKAICRILVDTRLSARSARTWHLPVGPEDLHSKATLDLPRAPVRPDI